MVRYLVIFSVILGVALVMMAGILAQSGYSLFAPEMRMMLLVCVLVAAYVSWRIATILKRREENAADRRARGDTPSGGGLFGSMFGGKSKAQLDREARVAARRRKLVAEGKLEPEPADLEPQAPTGAETDAEAPTRVSSSATVKEKMAARAERVRRAREEGKI